MKKRGLFLIMSALLFLSACNKTPQPETPANTVQTDVEKQQNYGSVFARINGDEFYYRSADGKTVVTCKAANTPTEVAALEGVWRFSPAEQTQSYAYVLFDGYKESAQGYSGSVFMYTKETGVFAPIFEEKTSNAVLLPTEDENYADLAWVLVQAEDGAVLCPINLRDGNTETGQIVSLADTDYAIEGDNVLVSLKTDTENPLMLRIENKAYDGSSVLSTTAYHYDFEENKLTKITEEE